MYTHVIRSKLGRVWVLDFAQQEGKRRDWQGGGSVAGAEDLAAQQDRRRHEPDRGEGRAGALLASAAVGLRCW